MIDVELVRAVGHHHEEDPSPVARVGQELLDPSYRSPLPPGCGSRGTG